RNKFAALSPRRREPDHARQAESYRKAGRAGKAGYIEAAGSGAARYLPVEVVVPEGRQQTPAVGQRATRADARLHGLGQTKYIDDMYFPNMLFAKIKRAGIASA